MENNIFKDKEELTKYIKQKTKNSEDVVYKEFEVQKENILFVYTETLVSAQIISDSVIGRIKELVQEKTTIEEISKIADTITNNEDYQLELPIQHQNKTRIKAILSNLQKTITFCKVKQIDNTQEDIFYYLYSGFCLVYYEQHLFAVETRGNLERSISEPTTEFTVKGPKEAFVENYSTNIGLIRKRLKGEDLVLQQEIVGRRSKTKVGILYISSIASSELVQLVEQKIQKIDIDGIIDSNYIAELIGGEEKENFPVLINTERPDLTSFYLLEGRVALVVENSPYVLILPAFLNDFINSIDDYYQKSSNVTITRIIRYLAFVIAIITPRIIYCINYL